MKLSNLIVDQSASEEGVWQDLGVCEMRIAFASLTNKSFQKVLKDLTDPHRIAIQYNAFPPEKALDLNYQAYAACIVKDWRGITDDDDKPIPFSKERCLELFRGNPRIFEVVQKVAGDDVAYRAQVLKDSAKN